jgi:hypothetical protein
MIRRLAALAAAMTIASTVHAQAPTQEQIMRQLPLEGAPLVVPGPYAAAAEPAFGSPRLAVYRPTALDAFPSKDKLPVVVWGNGGCLLDTAPFSAYLTTLASHGFLVVTTASPEGATPPRATVDDMRAAIDWAQAESKRSGSPLASKIDTENVAAIGVSCGGFLAVGAAADPRVDTVGVFNSGVQPPRPNAPAGAPAFPTTESLAAIHSPTLYLNGAEPDFMFAASRANFDAINHVPAFYGSRDNAGHSATYRHPGGGEFANVTVAWLKWQLKDDKDSANMFVGDNCGLCRNPNWVTQSKGGLK